MKSWADCPITLATGSGGTIAKAHHTRRAIVAQLIGCGTVSGCAAISAGQSAFITASGLALSPPPAWMQRHWNDPQNAAIWDGMFALTREMRNTWKDGLAVSAGGRYVAVPVGASPINTLTIVEPATSKRWRIAHPNPRVMLKHPTFSPDGSLIAMVVSPPTYAGNCEVWVSPVQGGPVKVLRSARPRSMFWPAFSWDGGRIACLRDVSPPPANILVMPEYQGSRHCAAFEYDLKTGTETKVNGRVVNGFAARLAYASNNQDLLLGAQTFAAAMDERLAAATDCGDGKSWCRDDPGPIQPPAGLVDGRKLFELQRGSTTDRYPPSARPRLFGPGALFDRNAVTCGVDSSGHILVSHIKQLSKCDDEKIIATLDQATSPLGVTADDYECGAISSDGAAIAGSLPLGFEAEGTRIDVLHGGIVTGIRLRPSDDGDHNTALLNADPSKSEFAA